MTGHEVTAADVDRARRIAHSFVLRAPADNRSMIRSDAMSDALIGLALAARDFDPDRGVPWSSYAGLQSRNAIVNGIRHRQGHRGGGSVVAQMRLAPSGVNQMPWLDSQAEPVGDPMVAEFESAETARALYRQAQQVIAAGHSINEGRVFRERVAGRSQREIADDLGVTESRVSQISARIVRRMVEAGVERP